MGVELRKKWGVDGGSCYEKGMGQMRGCYEKVWGDTKKWG